MPKIIDANEFTIGQLLDQNGSAYEVPRHQRQFEWSSDQWQDLWDDIHNGSVEDSHFLGSIVVIPEQHRAGINYFQVNDGQQRLTTILIFLAVIRDTAKKIGNTDLARFIEDRYLNANYFDSGVKQVVPKLKLGRLDDDQFRAVILGQTFDVSKKGLHRIFECYKYFYEAVGDVNEQQLEDLRRRVLDKIIVVHINVANQLNAFRLFETLNDRGLELSAVDLIKNYLLALASGRGTADQIDSIVEAWQEMYETIRDHEPVRFFYRFMLSEYPGKISERKLYEEITDRASKENWGIDEVAVFVGKLNKAAVVYAELVSANTGNKKIDRRLVDIRYLEAEPAYTLLLKITPLLKGGTLSEHHYLQVIDLVELFHIRWGICGQSTGRMTDIYNGMCSRLGTVDPSVLPDFVETEYLAWAAPINDTAFSRAFAEAFKQPSAQRTKYIIWKLGNPAGEVSLNFDEVHTEHIMPKSLNQQWIADLSEDGKMDAENVRQTHDLLVNKVGNFALIKGEWNIGMSNRAFLEKKDYYKDSEIGLTKDLAGNENWTFDDIIARTKVFSEKAVVAWKFNKPIPEAEIELKKLKTTSQKYLLSEDLPLFCKGPSAEAEGRLINNMQLRVLQGSKARSDIAPAFSKHGYKNLRDDLVNQGVLKLQGKFMVFNQDYDFSSPSAAAAVVLGRSADGPSEWKDLEGRSIYHLTKNQARTNQ